ncbi:MAG: hypothetical protein ACLUOF_03640 [Ruminococcus sp.]
MKQTILIRNVQVVQGDVMPRCDMLIQDGVIAKFGRDLPDAAGDDRRFPSDGTAGLV